MANQRQMWVAIKELEQGTDPTSGSQGTSLSMDPFWEEQSLEEHSKAEKEI